MKAYYVNKASQDNEDHEVHTSDCRWLPNPENQEYLGEFSNCADAVEKAKKTYPTADGCAHCCPACHTS